MLLRPVESAQSVAAAVMARGWIDDIIAGRTCTPDLAAGARIQHLTDLAVASAALDGRLLGVTTRTL